MISVTFKFLFLSGLALVLAACDVTPWNNPYPSDQDSQSILYTSFSERPKHLDPAKAYSSNEYALIGQIYEPLFQYHYLKRPYSLTPLTASAMPEIKYLGANGVILPNDAPIEQIAYTDYLIEIQSGIKFQPHPAFAKRSDGAFVYQPMTARQLAGVKTLRDFDYWGSRELVAEDYIYQIKRLVHPGIHSPIAELMKQHIVGLSELGEQLASNPDVDLRTIPISGVKALGPYRYRIRIKSKYPQFIYWLAMPFFAPMPWEAVQFYQQPGLQEKNITLDWFPVGTGPYMLEENNPNLRMTLSRNPNFHFEAYPEEGETEDETSGLLTDAGKKLPFIEHVVYILEKENIPYWNKFLQGYYDASGITSDSFDQAVQFTGTGDVQLTAALKDKHIQLQTTVTTSIFYMGFNMMDPVLGGDSESARLLRQAIALAIDYEEYISIFMNGRGVAAQGLLPPGIFGFVEDEQGINPHLYEWTDKAQRKPIEVAKRMMRDAGYPEGVNPATGQALILYLDTAASGPDDRARLNWYRKQFAKLGIQLVIRGTDYNRFQQKMRTGNAQIFLWGWNADYPDPENFFFLLYGPNGKVNHGGENAVNYANEEFDRLFEQMRNMDNTDERHNLIQQMQAIIRHDAPWVFGFHPKSFSLYQSWYQNLKPNLMANNRLKYTKIDADSRARLRAEWNQPIFWPLVLFVIVCILLIVPAIVNYRKRTGETLS